MVLILQNKFLLNLRTFKKRERKRPGNSRNDTVILSQGLFLNLILLALFILVALLGLVIYLVINAQSTSEKVDIFSQEQQDMKAVQQQLVITTDSIKQSSASIGNNSFFLAPIEIVFMTAQLLPFVYIFRADSFGAPYCWNCRRKSKRCCSEC